MVTLQQPREAWIDRLRVWAIFLVMLTHSAEPFYLGGDGSLILTAADRFWAALFVSFSRACVAIFVIASSYLQFPLKRPTGEFFRRRAVRILIPLAIWSVAYALCFGSPVENLKDLLLNFNYCAGHLWFVYMLVGLYLIMPLLSPWAEKVSKKELSIYLGIWGFTLLIPLFRHLASDSLTVIYGPTGIPQWAKFPLWGESSWNQYGVFYYLSGFAGYLLLGLWLRKFAGEWSWKKTLAVALPCLLLGFGICFTWFLGITGKQAAVSGYPLAGRVELAVGWEMLWCNDTIGIPLMALGWILIFRKFNCCGRRGYEKLVRPIAVAGYGIYLSHMFALSFFSGLFRSTFGVGADGTLGLMTQPVEILLTAACSFVCVSAACVLIQKIPVVGKALIG